MQPFDWADYPMEDDPEFRDDFCNVALNEEVKSTMTPTSTWSYPYHMEVRQHHNMQRLQNE